MRRILPTLILAALLLPTASRAQTPPGDPYLCYKAALAKTDPPQPKFATVRKTLEDQFGTLVQDVKGIQSVCNPPLAAARPDVHQVGYKLAPAKTTPAQPKFVKTNHTAYDQFGTHPLTVVKPAEVRAPSAKVLGAGGTGPVDTTGVDHFECYRVTPAKGAPKFVPPAPVAITDEFGTQNVTLAKITRLCTPVNKNGEDATAPGHVGHLVCYQAKLPKGTKFAAQTVSVNNANFGAAVLSAKAVAEYCVPAFKDTVPTATATPAVTPTPIATATPTTCSAAQPCAGGVECCAGTCLPPDAFCRRVCSRDTYLECTANAQCGFGQTCLPLGIVPNTCGAGTCLTDGEFCCGASTCCQSVGEVCETATGRCLTTCLPEETRCDTGCCAAGQSCVNGACRESCGSTSCDVLTQKCCGQSCCDAATQFCDSNRNECIPRTTCTGTDVYMPATNTCCAQAQFCGTDACCNPGLQRCDTATGQCVPL